MRARTCTAAAAMILVLAGCGGSEEPDAPSSDPGTATSISVETDPGELANAICEALDAARTMPAPDVVEYEATFSVQTGWATNAPVCRIEPVGDYYDVAAHAGEFGRAEFSYAPSSGELRLPEYDPADPASLLTLDQAVPVSDEVPCADEPCDGIHGYQYNYRFATVSNDFVMIAELDYITTNTTGELQDDYRDQALAAFTDYMVALAGEL